MTVSETDFSFVPLFFQKEDDGKKVSYFAVIAAALISAIVFFVLGYLASILKNKRRKITLPWVCTHTKF